MVGYITYVRGGLRTRRFYQDNFVEQSNEGVVATYTYDLHIEYGIYNHDPYSDVSE